MVSCCSAIKVVISDWAFADIEEREEVRVGSIDAEIIPRISSLDGLFSDSASSFCSVAAWNCNKSSRREESGSWVCCRFDEALLVVEFAEGGCVATTG